MLGKLLKHEFKVTSRWFFPMFLVIAVITVLLKISMILSEGSIFLSLGISTMMSIIEGLFIALYVIILIGTSILALFLLIKRFYSNMFGNEGYLTHTLPVTGTQLLNSKLICSFTWIMSLIPIWIISFLILFAGTDIFSEAGYYTSAITEEIHILNVSGFSIGLIVLELVLLAILSTISALLDYYLSITLGQHYLGEHRLLGAILFYFILSVVSSTISSVFTTVLENVLLSNAVFLTMADAFKLITGIFGYALIVTSIQTIVYYMLTRYFLTKKLNLH